MELQRVAVKVLIYKVARMLPQPLQTRRVQRKVTLSRVSGATPNKAAISRPFNRPSLGTSASKLAESTGLTQVTLCRISSCSRA
jgi:hypothetical protein